MLKNPNPKTDWKVGDTCYYQETWTQTICSGTIKEIANPGGVARVEGNKEHPGCIGCCFDRLFATKEEALATAKAESIALVKKYEDEMPDVAAVIRFAYDHNVSTCEEYTDWEARTAYRNRAKALLGLDLGD